MLTPSCTSIFFKRNIFHNNTIKSSFTNILRNQFSRRKGLQENIKQKQINIKNQLQEQSQQLSNNAITNQKSSNNNALYSPQSLIQLSKAKIMNMQFFPISLLLTPTMLYCNTFQDPYFLIGTLLAEKYSSLMLLMNVNFQQNKKLSFLLMFMIAGLHTLTGYYSLGTPLGMAFATIILPFKFSDQKQRYSQTQKERMRSMINIRMVYFFVFTLLTTIKAFHYEAVYEMDKKLAGIDEENKMNILNKLE